MCSDIFDAIELEHHYINYYSLVKVLLISKLKKVYELNKKKHTANQHKQLHTMSHATTKVHSLFHI